MLTSRIRIQVIAFIVLGVVATSYLGARYVGIGGWFGDDGYRISARLPATGGIFKNGEVTYRGVPVGRIGDLTLTQEGVAVELDIDAGAPEIPSDVEVQVANRSAIGEQYIDLRPQSDDGPYLQAGDVVTGSDAALPPDISEVLSSSRNFAASVPLDDLRTVVDETYLAFQGSGDDLRRLISTSADFIGTADRNYLTTSSLIQNSDTVLATQREAADDIRDFSGNLRDIAATLKSSDPQLRTLIGSTPAAARQFDALITEIGTPLGVLLSNLITPAQIFGTQAKGIRDLFSEVPRAVGVGYAVTGSQGIRVGVGTTFFNPAPCVAGYGSTAVRPGTDTTTGQPFNTEAGCTTPPTAGGADVRGPLAAPQGDSSDNAPKANRVGSISVPSDLSDLLGGDQ